MVIVACLLIVMAWALLLRVLKSWMTQCPPGRRDAAPAPNDVILGPLIAFVRLPLHGQLRQPLRPVPAAGRLSRALAGHTSGTAVAHVVHHPRCEGGSR